MIVIMLPRLMSSYLENYTETLSDPRVDYIPYGTTVTDNLESGEWIIPYSDKIKTSNARVVLVNTDWGLLKHLLEDSEFTDVVCGGWYNQPHVHQDVLSILRNNPSGPDLGVMSSLIQLDQSILPDVPARKLLASSPDDFMARVKNEIPVDPR